MKVHEVLRVIINEAVGREVNEAREFCKEYLEGEGWAVCENTDELRQKALEETDLVEPE